MKFDVDWALNGYPDADDIIDAAAAGLNCQQEKRYWDIVTDLTEEQARAFIKRLIKYEHTSVLEHLIFKFVVNSSRVVSHQQVRHRIASYTQTSHRVARDFSEENYIEYKYKIPEEYYDEWVEDIKENAQKYHKWLDRLSDMEDGVDLARRVLRHDIATQIRVTMNARSLRNWFYLRLTKHADFEFRAIAAKLQKMLEHKDLWWLFEDLENNDNTNEKDG